jgi:ATP-dependent exoDNAse (exonuclease V) alpha subunit
VSTDRTYENRPYPITALDWTPRGTEHRLEHCPVPKQLWLCMGARVMCLKNITDRLVNGSVGAVHHVEVVSDASGKVVGLDISVKFDGQLGDDAFFHTFHTHRDGLAEDVQRVNRFSVRDEKQKEVAYRIQIPLRHAWACSIHKAQGCSLERVIIDFEGCFADGQAYTALSRVRTLAGAWLVNLREQHMRMVSRQAKRWYEALDVQQWE